MKVSEITDTTVPVHVQSVPLMVTSHRGHPLMWLKIFGITTCTINTSSSLPRHRSPLKCGHNYPANGVALLEGDYCMC